MKFTEIMKRNRELESTISGPVYKIAVISNIVTIQLKEILELSLRENGIKAQVIFGEYDAIVQDSGSFRDVQAVIVFWEVGNLIDGLQNRCYSMSAEELTALAERVEGEMSLLFKNLSHVPLVLINQFTSMVFEANALRWGPMDELCNRLNLTLRTKIGTNNLVVDLNSIIAKVGLEQSVDFRQFLSSKALYTIDFFKAFSEAVRPSFLAVTGKAKKVIVMDCDNTLWDGILGEDGETGIKMSDLTSKGKAFREVQTLLLGMRKEGVLLAICSKNNPEDVEKVFHSHPDMILRPSDIVAKKVNWLDKATNLRDLAEELNLGLDSFVFVDDSDFELGLIRQELSQIKCIQVPKQISEYPALIRQTRRDFFTLSRSSEDEKKTVMYQQDQMRKDQSKQFSSTEDYLASLQLKLNVFWNNHIPVPRVAQLSQKTNQFNLTTKRYTEADILRMQADPNYNIAAFSILDRYGDYGVTGLAIFRRDGIASDSVTIDSFLMSCRVIGRNLEYAFFNHAVEMLRNEGLNHLNAQYISTPKNSQVEKFYDELGLSLISSEENSRDYKMELRAYTPKTIDYITVSSQ